MMTVKNEAIYKRITAFVLCLALLVVSSNTTALATFSSVKKDKVLFIADTFPDEISPYDSQLVDMHTSAGLDIHTMLSYRAVALPYNNGANNDLAQELFSNNVLVYLYGKLSITDYKQAVGLSDFSLDVALYNDKGPTTETVSQGFDSSFENEEQFNVISYGSHALLCFFEEYAADDPTQKYSITINSYINAVYNNFSELDRLSDERNFVLRASDYNLVQYWGNDQNSFVKLEYFLFKEESEKDPLYDYFGIRTAAWAKSASKTVCEVNVSYELPPTNYNLIETAPKTTKNVSKLSASIGFSKAGLNASLSIEMDTNKKPDIICKENYDTDNVKWSMKQSASPAIGNLPYLDDTHLCTGATWSCKAVNYVGIDVLFSGVIGVGASNQQRLSSGTRRIPIRLSY